jgi:hypothetical protein
MPANLTPDYLAAEERFREAVTLEDKIAALEEMMAVIPKHKGTDHLRGDLKRRLSKLKELQEQQRRSGRREAAPWRVERQGAGQVLLVGAPNAGKSAIVATMTHAHPTVADYPFTTQMPVPGMMDFENVQIQLIDTPPIAADFMEGWMGDLLRRADACWLVVNLASDDLLEETEVVLNRLREKKIVLCGEIPEEREPILVYRRTLMVGNQRDAPDADARWEILSEVYAEQFPMISVSTKTGEGLEELRRRTWDALRVIRVYSKPPGQKPDMGVPFILKEGSTVLDMAAAVHKDFAENLKQARVWGSARFPGQSVERTHVLRDGDIVELHV